MELKQIISALWKKKILIAAVTVLCAVMMAIGSAMLITPTYQSDILIYVNNNSISHNGTAQSFSSGELTAARQLLNSYVVALKSRQCLDSVIEKSGLPYTRNQLKNMISAKSVNDTEWFTVSVVSPVPEEAQIIANTVAEVLPNILSNTIEGSSVEVVDLAVMPEGKASPGYTTYAFYGLIFGLVMICILVILKEMLNDKVQSEQTLTELSDSIPILANIPHKGISSNYYKYGGFGNGKKKHDKVSTGKNKLFDDMIAVCDELDFATSEAYKLLQTSVQYSFESNGCKVIGITSSERNEGKSTLAINLSYMLSCDKKKVLLLEGDMRLPSLSKKLGIESTPGLSDCLIGKTNSNECIQYSKKAPALSVICAGVVPPNPFSLLGSVSMERLLNSLKEEYDYIVVDLPPVNIVSDPLAIAKYLDGFIVAIRSKYTTKKGVSDLIQKLQIVNSNIIGFVINGDGSASEKKYSKYSKYGYQDKSYESSYERASKKQVVRSNSLKSDDNSTEKL